MEKTLKDIIKEGVSAHYYMRKPDKAVVKVYSLELSHSSLPYFKAFEVKQLTEQGAVPKGIAPFDIPLIESELNKYEVISSEKAKELLKNCLIH